MILDPPVIYLNLLISSYPFGSSTNIIRLPIICLSSGFAYPELVFLFAD